MTDIQKTTKQTGLVTGQISINSKGIGFVKNPQGEEFEDFEIPTIKLHTALHRDEVEIKLLPEENRGRQLGEVTKIITRAKMRYTGALKSAGLGFNLVPDDQRMYANILILPNEALNGKADDKVYVEITEWDEKVGYPIGKVLEVIGRRGEHNAEMRAIVLERGLAYDFPEAVEREAEKIGKEEQKITAAEIATRRDFRQTVTFTIDPIDAKDFDDAISVKKLPDGTYEIGVHIADVSHYVREGTALDAEARSRGFSVYLVDRTIPMLPEVLSNSLCSLNPREDKLTFSAVFTMNMKGEVLSRWFGKTVINSFKRFTYEAAQETMDAKNGEYYEELTVLNQIAYKLRDERYKDGAIDFEQDEVKFQLDETGKPIRVYRKKRFDAHKLVEEFMLLGNREVAEHMFKALENRDKAAFIYRIHSVPDSDRIENLALFVKAMGYNLPVGKGGVDVKDIQKLIKSVEGKPEESLIKTAAVRSMAKAVYSVSNIGHFGLAFKYYTHFTSPIRRYADLLVHRLLFQEIQKGKIASGAWEMYKKLADESSEREVKAAEAERASIKYKQVEYMSERVGKIFDGSISGVTEWGIFLEETETKSEGMVRLRDLGNDFFKFDPKNYCVVGEKTGKKFRLGDKVRFKILKADLEKKTIDLALVQ